MESWKASCIKYISHFCSSVRLLVMLRIHRKISLGMKSIIGSINITSIIESSLSWATHIQCQVIDIACFGPLSYILCLKSETHIYIYPFCKFLILGKWCFPEFCLDISCQSHRTNSCCSWRISSDGRIVYEYMQHVWWELQADWTGCSIPNAE